MSKVKTNWYKVGQKPVRKGVYETRWKGRSGDIYQYWNGVFWCFFNGSPERAALPTQHRYSSKQLVEWRGFTTEQTKGSK